MIQSSSNLPKLKLTMLVQVNFVLSARMNDVPVLEKLTEASIKTSCENFSKHGFELYARGGHVRPMSRDEILAMMPRKKHFERKGHQVCDTQHVSLKNLTRKRSEVTCKLCLKKIARTP